MMARLKRLFGLQFLVVAAVFCAVGLHSAMAWSQITINIFDFDGTLMEDRQIRDGAFNPDFVLYRNTTRLNLFQDVPTGPDSVVVTHQDLEKMKPYLAQGEGRPGAIGRTVKLANGLEIRPGEYFLRNPDSFKYFRESPVGENVLLQQFKDAERVAAETGKTWKGPAWEYFVKLCETAEGARTIAISTARGHAVREWEELFEYLHERGHIANKPNAKRVFGMMRAEFDKYNGTGGALGADPYNIPFRKAGQLRELLLDLRNVALPPRLPSGERVLHEVRFFENSPENLNALQRVTREIIFADVSPTRVTLINVGLTTDVREARELGRPEVAILEPGSAVFRPGKREDFLLPTKSLHLFGGTPSRTATSIRTCESLFLGVAL